MRYLNLSDFQDKLNAQADKCANDREAMQLIRRLMDDKDLILDIPQARWDISIEPSEDDNSYIVSYCCGHCDNVLDFPIDKDKAHDETIPDDEIIIPALFYCPFCGAIMTNPEGNDTEGQYNLIDDNEDARQATEVVDLTEYIQAQIEKALLIEKMKKKIKKEVKKEIRKQLDDKNNDNKSAN